MQFTLKNNNLPLQISLNHISIMWILTNIKMHILIYVVKEVVLHQKHFHQKIISRYPFSSLSRPVQLHIKVIFFKGGVKWSYQFVVSLVVKLLVINGIAIYSWLHLIILKGSSFHLLKILTIRDALDALGLKRYCCRRMLLTHVDLIEKLYSFFSTLFLVLTFLFL